MAFVMRHAWSDADIARLLDDYEELGLSFPRTEGDGGGVLHRAGDGAVFLVGNADQALNHGLRLAAGIGIGETEGELHVNVAQP